LGRREWGWAPPHEHRRKKSSAGESIKGGGNDTGRKTCWERETKGKNFREEPRKKLHLRGGGPKRGGKKKARFLGDEKRGTLKGREKG